MGTGEDVDPERWDWPLGPLFPSRHLPVPERWLGDWMPSDSLQIQRYTN